MVFSGKWGRFIMNDETGEKIHMEKVNGTYIMKVDVEDVKKGKTVTWEKKGEGMYKKTKDDEMDVDGVDEEEADELMMAMVGGQAVFQRRMQ